MTDIVERLRLFANAVYIAADEDPADDISGAMREAADEIDRLREENKFLRSLVADELRALKQKP